MSVITSFFPRRHVLSMITTDEELWPLQSSDVTQEGYLSWSVTWHKLFLLKLTPACFITCFFPWRHVLLMITADEKSWPWRSSDVIKEGMLASTELLSVFTEPQHTLCRYLVCTLEGMLALNLTQIVFNELQHALSFTNSVSVLDAMFCLQSQQMRNFGHGGPLMLLKKVCLPQLNCYLTQIVFNELHWACLVFY